MFYCISMANVDGIKSLFKEPSKNLFNTEFMLAKSLFLHACN